MSRPDRAIAGAIARVTVDATAPPERLAAFRVLTGVFAVAYLLIRLPVFLALRHRDPAGFDPVGILAPLGRAVPDGVVVGVIGITVATGLAYCLGWRFAATAPAFALGLLALTTYRSSWGQLLHFENLMVIYVVLGALAPAADAWSLDARRSGHAPRGRDGTAYGWPLALAALVLVTTYVLAGIAKLRYGGLDWLLGDTLRNHVAYSAGRLELLGGTPSPIAGPLVERAWIFPPMATAAVAVELAAPLALLGGRVRDAWVVATWLMHAGILALMLVGFPYPLFLVAFAPLYPLERLARRVTTGVRRRLPREAAAA